jgi:hypothetical protein
MPSNATQLPLTVLIPTKNSRAYLPGHLEGMKGWLDLVQEIIVVDSFSTDGTVEFLRAELKHPNVKFLTHPPGLYASWNSGIANVQTEYVYISTTGDTISRDGIETLLRTFDSLNCDVVVSKPEFRNEDGTEAEDIAWPVDDVVRTLQVKGARKLSRLEAILFAAANPKAALLGSVASDMFRTSALKRFPFPTEFGTAGDGAWGLMHAAEVPIAVVPEKFSCFLRHPTGASEQEKKALKEARSADGVINEAMERWRSSGLVTNEDLQKLRWPELIRHLSSYLDAKQRFDKNRRGQFPWFLNPAAWSTRLRRTKSWNALHECKRAALSACADPS